MKELSVKNILIIFIVIVAMSKIKHIMRWVSEIFNDEMLSLEPIRDFPDGARAAITVFFFLLVFVVIWKLVLKK